ncbi:MAG: diacylglycerol/lipid kinase family protein [Bryobacteraceae bacterium]
MTTAQKQSIALLWNASSGWTDSEAQRESIRSILASNGSNVDVIQVVEGVDIRQAVEAAVTAGADVLAAAGGDGTVNAAASALLHRPTALGVIPTGTLNHLARDLKLPIDEEKAARALISGSAVSIDAATVNGRVFVNNSVLGFFPHYRGLREKLERHGFGSSKVGRFLAVLLGLTVALVRLPKLSVSYTVNGRKRTLRTPFVLVGNNEHRMEGLALGERATLNGGKLWVYVMRPHNRWQLLIRVIGVLLGRTPRESLFEIFSAPHVTIECKRRRVGVGVDGEVVRLNTPLQYKSLPGALRVLVPTSNPSS